MTNKKSKIKIKKESSMKNEIKNPKTEDVLTSQELQETLHEMANKKLKKQVWRHPRFWIPYLSMKWRSRIVKRALRKK